MCLEVEKECSFAVEDEMKYLSNDARLEIFKPRAGGQWWGRQASGAFPASEWTGNASALRNLHIAKSIRSNPDCVFWALLLSSIA